MSIRSSTATPSAVCLALLVAALLADVVPARATRDAPPRLPVALRTEPSYDAVRRDFIAGRLARDVAAVDFDEDGHLDLAVARFDLAGGDRVELLRGDGAGRLERVASQPTVGGVTAIVAADVNADGHDDLVTAGFLDDALGLHLGDGHGGFVLVPLPLPVEAPFDVAVDDVDGDSHLDLVVPASSSGVTLVLLGDGDGGFTSGASLPSGIAPGSASTGDLDADGHVDLVVTDADGDRCRVFRGAGGGTFLPPVVLEPGARPVASSIAPPLAAGEPTLLAVALRDDSLVRVYAWPAGASQPIELAGLEAGQNPQAVRFAHLAPGERGLVIAAQSSDQLVLHDRVETVPAPRPEPVAPSLVVMTQASPTAVAIGDWTGDGIDDYVLPGFNTESVSLHVGDGVGGVERPPFVEVPGSVASILPVDLDGDPLVDLAVLRIVDRRVSVLRGVAPGQYEAVDLGEPLPQVPTGLATLDLDGDDQPDFVTGNALGSDLWLLGSAGGYALTTATFGGAGPTSLVAADFDGDGDDDIAATLFLSGLVSIVENDGTGGFAAPRIVVVGGAPLALTHGDWNGDSRRDLAYVDFEDDALHVLLQGIDGGFDRRAVYATAVGAARGVAPGQLDGRGATDLVVSGDAGIELFAGDGAGGFASLQRFATAAEFEGVRVADLDGDGRDDVVAADRSGHGIVIHPAEPTGNGGPLGSGVAFGTDRGPVDLVVASLDGDARPDLAIVARPGGRVTLLLSAGRASRVAVGETAAGDGTPAVDAMPAATLAATPAAMPAHGFVAPNPFAATTRLSFDLAAAGRAVLRIYDAQGRLVARPYDDRPAGTRLEIVWDGRDLRGASVARGVYFYELEVGGTASRLRGKLLRR